MESLKTYLLRVLLISSCAASAHAQDFSGEWSIDLRSEQQKQQMAECGAAHFNLTQAGERITGSHQFYTVGCGRINEGGPESVNGIAIGNTAILSVRSERTGTIVLGKATLEGDSLSWESLEEIYPGLQGDSPLILGKGLLKKASSPTSQ
ncbi:hypothetical protein [Pseudomonas mangrovi]|jgi:hypothetical protein|uniref:hypothetical protein n=1 Tax=Pseudomonas mangrovi TaxID=2161748 RepID=UPI0011B210D7|nr:hypothetical protein [Pseudomonas mangrovi]